MCVVYQEKSKLKTFVHVSFLVRLMISFWTLLFFLSYHIYFKPFSSVLLQTLAYEHQRMISGDVCKHFSTTILPKYSDSIYAVQWHHGNSVCHVTNVPGHFPEDLSSYPPYFTVRD